MCLQCPLSINVLLPVPKKTTQREYQHLVMSLRHNHFLTSTALAAHLQATRGTRFSFSTICNRLRTVALRSRRPLVGVLLTQHHCHAHMNWAWTCLIWTIQQWARVVFTDDSIFRQLMEDFGSGGKRENVFTLRTLYSEIGLVVTA